MSQVIDFTIQKNVKLHVPETYFDAKNPTEWALDCIQKFSMDIYNEDIIINNVERIEEGIEFGYYYENEPEEAHS